VALAVGEAIDELRAQARASYTLDWALFEMGRTDEATYSRRALEIYRLLGDPDHEGIVLNNLGGFAYWGGRWSEAIDLYHQAGACRQRAGNAADAAQTYANIGEILSDQGRLEEAERHLLRAERVWTSTGHREGAAFASMLLGRLSVRAGRGEEGVALLEATAADMRKVGVGYYADLANALVAEGESMGGSPERGLEVASELLGSGCTYVALLRRASGIALWRMDEPEAAQSELEQALSEARDRGEDYEVALALDALSVLNATDADQDSERDAIVEQLGIERLPSLTDLRQGTVSGSPR
jgi:tetratricopeptide (TPR) repeat protein